MQHVAAWLSRYTATGAQTLPLRWLLLAVLLTRVLMCAAYVLFDGRGILPISYDNLLLMGTEDGYLQIAHHLYSTGEWGYAAGLAAHNRPPLQPLLLLPTAAAWPAHWYVLWYAITLGMAALTLWLLAHLAQLLLLSPARRNLLLLVYTLHPLLILSARVFTFICLAMLLITALAYLGLLLLQGRRVAWPAGALCGLGVLTHGSLQVLPMLLAALLLWQRRWLATGIVLFSCCWVAMPWAVHNVAALDRPIFTVTGMGYQYWKGEESAFAHKDAGERAYLHHTGRPVAIAYWGTVNPDDDTILWQLGLAHMQANPLHVMQRIAIGAWMFWAPWERGWHKGLILTLLNIPLLLWVIYCLYRRRAHWQLTDTWLLGMVLSLWAVFAFFSPNASYFPMLLPILLILWARHSPMPHLS